jgi:hypothetical protein
MTEADVSAITEMWARASQAAAVELPWSEIEVALGLLPKPEASAVSDDPATLLLLGPTDVLFVISVEGGRVRVTSRPLDAPRLSVSLEWSEPAPGTRATRWAFAYGDMRERWQTISGSVVVDRATGGEDLDERELFARILASRAGWPSYARPSAEAAAGEQPPGTDRPEPRWRAMTDIWGRPLRQDRR